jgi:hypothetical protein
MPQTPHAKSKPAKETSSNLQPQQQEKDIDCDFSDCDEKFTTVHDMRAHLRSYHKARPWRGVWDPPDTGSYSDRKPQSANAGSIDSGKQTDEKPSPSTSAARENAPRSTEEALGTRRGVIGGSTLKLDIDQVPNRSARGSNIEEVPQTPTTPSKKRGKSGNRSPLDSDLASGGPVHSPSLTSPVNDRGDQGLVGEEVTDSELSSIPSEFDFDDSPNRGPRWKERRKRRRSDAYAK